MNERAIGAPRRSLFGRLAIGLVGLASTTAKAEATEDGLDWPGKLTARHRQVVDAAELNGGLGLTYAYSFLAPNPGPGAATAVVVLRHAAFPIALNNAMWEKYKVGPSLKIIDPETKAPALKNPFLQPKPGVLVADEMAVDRLLAAGTVFGACNMALRATSAKLAEGAGTTPEEAAKEWAANLIPGITLLPSGTWGVNRAQEAGCTYCAG
jgi:hypothetical protein